MLETFFIGYIVIWMSICLVAMIIYARNPKTFAFSRPEYRRFLFVPWKLVTFAIAALGLTLIAPYTGDPTWDYFDALFMSALTFLSAPWVIGAIYLSIRGKLPLSQLFVALCIGMFSVSWSYDLYIVVRDGFYPDTWFANIFASSSLYIPAGLLWNLDWRVNRGVTFSFLESDWPLVPATADFTRVFWYALPFMLIAIAGIAYFLVLNGI
jgi:hypothetical protein